MAKRTLTVGYCYNSSDKPVAFIRLLGRWLEGYGFNVGDKITVYGESGRLVIRKE